MRERVVPTTTKSTHNTHKKPKNTREHHLYSVTLSPTTPAVLQTHTHTRRPLRRFTALPLCQVTRIWLKARGWPRSSLFSASANRDRAYLPQPAKGYPSKGAVDLLSVLGDRKYARNTKWTRVSVGYCFEDCFCSTTVEVGFEAISEIDPNVSTETDKKQCWPHCQFQRRSLEHRIKSNERSIEWPRELYGWFVCLFSLSLSKKKTQQYFLRRSSFKAFPSFPWATERNVL